MTKLKSYKKHVFTELESNVWYNELTLTVKYHIRNLVIHDVQGKVVNLQNIMWDIKDSE